jgi:Ca-activated chloride channel family protein
MCILQATGIQLFLRIYVMKRTGIVIGILLCMQAFGLLKAKAQYYMTGTVHDDLEKPLSFVRIRLKSTGALYETGHLGSFGFPSLQEKDTAHCYLAGYDTLLVILVAGKPNEITLVPGATIIGQRSRSQQLASLTPNHKYLETHGGTVGDESYSKLQANPMLETARYPSTGFSPNANTAAYSNIRRLIKQGSFVPHDAVKLEELVNYFPLSCAELPPPGRHFSIETTLTDCPWAPGNLLLAICMQARKLDLSAVPPANLVLLVDNSASMDADNRLPLLKSAFTMLVQNLRDSDRVSIVTYGGSASVTLQPTFGMYKDSIMQVLANIEAGGSTPGSQGIQLAYQLATTQAKEHENNRVILATDGDFNVGITDEKALEELIKSYSHTGVKLTCLGVGMGNYKDSKIETLARYGNGNFAYLDTEDEARKVLVTEFTETLYSVASNVTIHLDLDPTIAKAYRLTGYENMKQILADSASKLIGGEIGSGHAMVVLVELEPADTSAAWRLMKIGRKLGLVTVRHTSTENPEPHVQSRTIEFNYEPFSNTKRHLKIAATAAMYGFYLRRFNSQHALTIAQVQAVAQSTLKPASNMENGFLKLLNDTQKLYEPPPAKGLRIKWPAIKQE